MGYSCTVDASNMLGVIGKWYATDGNPNVLTIKGNLYFFERGREQSDGAITGSLFLCLPNDMARKAGTVRIESDGTLTRFPVIPQRDRIEINHDYLDMSARNPQLLRAWAQGRI